MATIESSTNTMNVLTSEVSQLKGVILEKDKIQEKTEAELKGLAKIAFPTKIEKCNYVNYYPTNGLKVINLNLLVI